MNGDCVDCGRNRWLKQRKYCKYCFEKRYGVGFKLKRKERVFF